MKDRINRLITYLWVVWHITKAYWKYTRELHKDPHLIKEYYFAEVPTFALEYYLKMMDGQDMDSNKLQFTYLCKREWEFRDSIASGKYL